MNMKRILFLTVFVFCLVEAFAQKRTYEYDELQRLAKTHYWRNDAKTSTVTYSYDAVGNRESKVVTVYCTNPTATLSGTQTINEGNAATLSVALTGDTPYNYTVNGQASVISPLRRIPFR
jgi:hypothetical protein